MQQARLESDLWTVKQRIRLWGRVGTPARPHMQEVDMALTIVNFLRVFGPNIGLPQNPDGSFRIGVEDVNSDEILAALLGGIPIIEMPDNIIVTGTIDANGEIVEITLPNGCASVALQIVGMPGASQINFEGTIDGTNWHPVEASNGTATVNATAGNDIFILPGAAYHAIRARATLWGVGAAAITFIASIGTAASILTGSLPAGTNNIGDVDVVSTETIQTELLAITAVAADAQQKSSELSLVGIKKAAVFIDHGRTAATAFVGAGTEYRVEVSEKATGNDTWRTIASHVCGIATASQITADGAEAIGQTVIEIGATTPAVGDILFWENATLALSEWMKVVAIAAGTTFTILDGLTNAQAAAKLIYNQAEQRVLLLDVEAYTRMRVVVNNNNGSTNVAIKSRIACITEK